MTLQRFHIGSTVVVDIIIDCPGFVVLAFGSSNIGCSKFVPRSESTIDAEHAPNSNK